MNKLKSILFALSIAVSPAVILAQDVGTAAPDFTLETLSSGSFQLSNHKGKVVFIFFFGYACPHCLSNGPNTQSGIYDVYKNNPDFVAVGIDTWDGNNSGVTNFRNSTGIGYPLCLKGSAVEKSYQTTYDRIVVIDKDGIIRYKATADATSGIVSDASDVVDIYLAKDPMMMGDGGDGGDDMPDDGGTVTSTEEEDPGKFNVYPSPANTQITITGAVLSHQGLKVKIVDVVGRVNFEKAFANREQLHIPVDQLKEGVYLVQLISPGESLSKRVLIRR